MAWCRVDLCRVGGFHGLLLTANHAWHALIAGSALDRAGHRLPVRLVSTGITFLCVLVGWVVFRADSLASAMRILGGMAGEQGVVLPGEMRNYLAPLMPARIAFGNATELLQLPLFQAWSVIWGGLFIVFLLPNVYQWMAGELTNSGSPIVQPAFPRFLQWTGALREAWLVGVLFGVSILSLTRVSEFLYFQF